MSNSIQKRGKYVIFTYNGKTLIFEETYFLEFFSEECKSKYFNVEEMNLDITYYHLRTLFERQKETSAVESINGRFMIFYHGKLVLKRIYNGMISLGVSEIIKELLKREGLIGFNIAYNEEIKMFFDGVEICGIKKSYKEILEHVDPGTSAGLEKIYDIPTTDGNSIFIGEIIINVDRFIELFKPQNIVRGRIATEVSPGGKIEIERSYPKIINKQNIINDLAVAINANDLAVASKSCDGQYFVINSDGFSELRENDVDVEIMIKNRLSRTCIVEKIHDKSCIVQKSRDRFEIAFSRIQDQIICAGENPGVAVIVYGTTYYLVSAEKSKFNNLVERILTYHSN